MISLILPYWDRQAAADKALRMLDIQYRDIGLEVVVVDDGGPQPFRAPKLGVDIQVVRMPPKDSPGAISAAINAGFEAATWDYICISAIEVLHTKPVLGSMAAELERIGPYGYVLAAAYCPEQKRWHCHSSVEVPFCPPGTGMAFCGMLRSDLYAMAEGFDEEYCEGAGWEDKDFIWRLTQVGARFSIRDDLVVIHPKAGAKIKWHPSALERNRRLFEQKWSNRWLQATPTS